MIDLFSVYHVALKAKFFNRKNLKFANILQHVMKRLLNLSEIFQTTHSTFDNSHILLKNAYQIITVYGGIYAN